MCGVTGCHDIGREWSRPKAPKEVGMPKRFKMSRKASRRDFSKHGSYTHKKNMGPMLSRKNPMRGGIRL